ncbi:alpha/beta hydrolase [Ideonella margarita]|uniref:Alpha/beta hydrolase n=1 Tax=Ideonella margarita TaxID=2984191 RepID=A0ABU9C3C5_9BURK
MLDLQLEKLLQHARAAGMPDLCDVPLPAARGLYRQLMSAISQPEAPVHQRDVQLPGVAEGSSLGARVYAPPDAHRLPVVLWFHGGGYVLGDLDAYDGLCRQLSLDAQAVVVSIDYRLAPEHPFPAAFDDARASLSWLLSAAGTAALGEAADLTRLAVAGDSAGAVLAASVALHGRDAGLPPLRCMALAYPPAAGSQPGVFPSRARHASGPTLTAATVAFFDKAFFGEAACAPDWRAAPLSAPSLAGLPPTLIQLAAWDLLRDEGEALAARMLAAGTPVTLVEFHGLAHGYLGQGAAVAAAHSALRQMGQYLHDGLRV